MTYVEARRLAATLGALLPWRTIGRHSDAPLAEVHRVQERLEAACLTAGLDALNAVILADSVTGYVLGWGGRDGTLEAAVARTTAILNLEAGGHDDADVQVIPTGTALSDVALAELILWLLLTEDED